MIAIAHNLTSATDRPGTAVLPTTTDRSQWPGGAGDSHANGVLNDVDYYHRALTDSVLLTARQERALAKKIFRLRQAFQRRVLRDRHAVDDILTLIRMWQDGRFRIDGLVSTALNNREFRRKIEPKLRRNLPTLEALNRNVAHADSPVEVRRLQHKIIRLVEELAIRPRHFEAAFTRHDALAASLLGQYRSLYSQMAQANLRLVFSIVNRMFGRHPRLADLLQEGTRGLMTAVVKFDHRRGLKFSTYATHWIRQAVSSKFTNLDRNIPIPENYRSLARQIRHAQRGPSEDDSEESLAQLAAQFQMSPSQMLQLMTVIRDTVSLEQPDIGGEEDVELRQLIQDWRNRSPRKAVQRKERRDILWASLRGLGANERKVLELKFGLDDGVSRNMAEVGRLMNLSRERIRQIQKRALENLEIELKEHIHDPRTL